MANRQRYSQVSQSQLGSASDAEEAASSKTDHTHALELCHGGLPDDNEGDFDDNPTVSMYAESTTIRRVDSDGIIINKQYPNVWRRIISILTTNLVEDDRLLQLTPYLDANTHSIAVLIWVVNTWSAILRQDPVMRPDRIKTLWLLIGEHVMLAWYQIFLV